MVGEGGGGGQAGDQGGGAGEGGHEVGLVGGELHHAHLVVEEPAGGLHLPGQDVVHGQRRVVSPVLGHRRAANRPNEVSVVGRRRLGRARLEVRRQLQVLVLRRPAVALTIV